jgi:uncharacterized protein
MTKSTNDKRIDYIEFAVHDIEKTKAFYGSVFGWKFKDYGPEYCEFRDGRLTGGFAAVGTPKPGGPLVIMYGNDLQRIAEKIVEAGGKISRPIFDFPGGQRFHFLDPSGYELAVWKKVR